MNQSVIDHAGADAVPGLIPAVQHNTEATSIATRFWARSIGDRNPRHVNAAYRSPVAAQGFCAHPCWLYSVHDTAVAGPPGSASVIAGTQWQFHQPVRLGERIAAVVRLLGQERKPSRHAGEALHQRIEVVYHDARGEPLATAVSTVLQIDPARAQAAGKHADWKRWRYTLDELQRIEAGYDSERVRGGLPRHWEDVAQGETLDPIVRGPLSSEEVVLFAGATRPIPGMAGFTRALAAGQAGGFIHPRTGAYESYAAGLVDDDSARQLGFPAAHDYGIDRIGQMASLLTNWCGDAGRLLSLDARLVSPHMFGDTVWFSGSVLRLRRDAAAGAREGLVDIEATGTNQRGEVSVRATATLALPLRTVPSHGSLSTSASASDPQ